ncbi:hypothetical protein [Sinosporangium album]|nr:hypothetical protein [Sinosporangium album]
MVTAGAGAALAVAAVGLVNGLSAGLPGAEETVVAQRPASAAQPEHRPKLPGSFLVRLGAKKTVLPLVHSQWFEKVGVAQKVTFMPTSFSTGYRVVCDDPRAWVVTSQRLKSGEMGGRAGRCGKWEGGHHDERSAPSDWLKRPQYLEVWVFPADAPVREVAEAVTGCRPITTSKKCDETAQTAALINPKVRSRLSAKVGEQPGRWAVGIYDRPAATAPAPSGEPSADAVLPLGGRSTPTD